MNNDSKTGIYFAVVLLALQLSACTGYGHYKTVGTTDGAMLMDEDVTPAANKLIRLQEQRPFPIDDRKMPYAMIDDRKKPRKISSGKPVSITEAKP